MKSNLEAPTISVLMCSYNYGRYLKQCFAGLQRQTFADFEIVLTEDGSTDESREIIAEFAARDPRFKVNYFERNQGFRAAADDVWKRARGDLIFGQAADDFLIDADFFARSVKCMAQHPTAAGYYGVVGLFSADTEKLVGSMGSAPAEGYNSPADSYRGFVKCKTVLPSSGFLFRRSYFQQHGGYDFSLGPQCDLYLNGLLASLYGVIFDRKPVACQRVYAKRTNFGASGNLWEMTARFTEVERRLRQLGISYPGMEEDWQQWRASWTLDCVRKTGFNVGVLPGAPAY